MRQMIVMVGAVLAMVALAMPTKQELVDVQPLVQELMRKDISAMNVGTKTPTQVADASVALVPSAETEASKFVLLRGAVTLYARDGQYDKAADALDMLLATVKDVPPETVEGIVSAAVRNTAPTKAPRLFAQYRAAKRKTQAAKELPELQARVKREPKNLSLRQSLAECLANMGEWKDALKEFARLDDDFAQAARFELDESSVKGYNALRAADFWWGYTAVDVEPFRIHAAELYRKAMSAGLVTGLRRKVVQNRLDEMAPAKAAPERKPSPSPAQKSVAAAASTSGWALPATFTPPLEKTLTLPSGEKVTFCACPAGSFQMSNPSVTTSDRPGGYHKVTLTRPFWISRTMLTIRQLKGLVPDNIGAEQVAREFPDKEVVTSYKSETAQALLDALNQRFASLLPSGYVFRLPTEAELEYAWTAAGTDRDTYNLAHDTFSALEGKGLLSKTESSWSEYWWHSKYFAIYLMSGNVPKNVWGVGKTCVIPPHFTLDRFNKPGYVKLTSSDIAYAAEEIDPVRKCEDPAAGYLPRMGFTRYIGMPASFALVIGPDLLGAAPAANPPAANGNTGTTGVSPVASSNTGTTGVSPVAATGFKASGDTPKPLSLDLGGGVKMEMVGCPAGQFYMGDKKNAGASAFAKGHMVELTRSFWIGKFPVTIEQWERLAGRRDPPPGVKRRDMDGKLPVQSCPEVPLTRADMEDFMARLTRKFKGKLPQGYVFRLPTNAEWEYALLAGMDAESAEDALRTSVVTMGDSKAYWQPRGLDVSALGEQHWDSKKWETLTENFPYVPVGARPANAWGICDMVGVGGELVLDSWRWQKTGGWGAVVEKNAAVWADGVKDPLLFEADSEVCLVRGNYKQQEPHGRWHTCLYGYSLAGKKYRRIYRLRVVAGPDLMKERGITPPASGK